MGSARLFIRMNRQRAGALIAATALCWLSSSGAAMALANRSLAAENGLNSGNAINCTDATAQGNSAVRYGQACSPSVGPITSSDMVKSTVTVHTGDAKMLADVTGDGKLDWIVGGNTGGEPLDIYPYPYATNSKTTIVNSQEEFTTDAEAADMDGDGDIDLVTPDGCSLGAIKVSLNGGNGASWTTSTIGSIPGHCLKDVEVADFDNNGRNDIAIRYDAIMIYYQTAAGVYSPTTIAGSANGAEGMDSADIDSDGDTDIIAQGAWLENPGTASANWSSFTIGTADAAFRATAADFNNDGKTDVAFSCAECGTGGNGNTGINSVYVYLNVNPKSSWTQFNLGTLNFAHTLEAADFNGDGDVDLMSGQMSGYAGSNLNVNIYDNGGSGTSWSTVALANNTLGMHIGRAGDIDGDGDIDFMGSNYTGNTTLNVYTNQTNRPGALSYASLSMKSGLGIAAPTNRTITSPVGPGTCTPRSLDSWSYTNVDSARTGTQFLWGLGMGDFDGDNDGDIVAGNRYYQNPGGPMTGTWSNGGGLSNASLITDIDGDALKDVIDLGNGISWKEWNGSGFSTIAGPVGTYGQQGYKSAQFIPGGAPEVVYSISNGGASNANGVVMASFSGTTITTVSISNQTADEGIGAGDIDNDGLIDIAIGDGTNIAWFKNPGGGAGNWTKNILGQITHGDGNGGFTDRTEIADIDNDGLLDVVTAEETFGVQADTYWFKNPGGAATGAWIRATIATQGSTNSMDVADMDDDGDTDVITGEHDGALTVAIWENQNNGGTWVKHTVSTGKESHLGARVMDLDNDGDKEIVSIAFNAPQNLHLWRNDSVASCTQSPCSVIPDIGLGATQYSVNLEATGLYRVWVRMWAPTTVANSVILNGTVVNGNTAGCGAIIGDNAATTAGQWTWVSYRDGNPASPFNLSLPAGTFNFSIRGREAGVKVDHIIMVRDTACVPTGLDGQNCTGSTAVSSGDSTPPVTTITSPTANATLSGTATIQANASDAVGVTKVEFYDGTNLIGTDLTSPYSTDWDTTTTMNGAHSLTSKAYDSAGNSATSPGVPVTVSNSVIGGAPKDKYLTFDGTNDRVTLGAINSTGSPLTVEGWIKNNDIANCGNSRDCRIVSKATSTSNNNTAWSLQTAQVSSQTRLQFKLRLGTTLYTATSGATVNMAQGQWYHVAAVFNGTAINLYIDGQLVNMTLASGTIPSNTTAPVWIGGTPTAGAKFWDGSVDEVRIWNTARTQTQIQTSKDSHIAGSTSGIVAYYQLNDCSGQSAVNAASSSWTGTLGSSTAVDSADPTWVCPTPDTTPPSTNITAPANGAMVSGTVSIAANATDTVGVTKVEFYDGASLISTDTTSPYSASWTTTQAMNGSHTLTSKAFDAANNSATSTPVTVNVNNAAPDTTPPTTTLTSPADGTTLTGTATISASASDDTGVSRVEFYDGTSLLSSDATSPYSISWDTTTAANGNHTLTSKAFDAANNSATSSPITVTVNNVVTPPPTGTPKQKMLHFDGAGDHVSVGNGNLNSTAFTLEAWIYSPDLWNCPNEECRILSKEDSGATANSVFALTTKASSNQDTRLQLQIKLNGTMQSFMGTTGDMWTNQWNHVAAVYNGSQVLLYVNGGQVGSFAASGTVTQTTAPLWIGAQPTSATNSWEGDLDDIRIWNTARTQAQIQAAYNAELVGNETGLAYYFRLNEASGQTATNSVSGGTNGVLGNTTAVEATDPTWK